ncbi:MAG: hypothetical protein JO236_16130 [Mycobacterium sp.]|uniref:hypothetical protein n=1 Tax=Mycobacterium sp. TaxID=1785 RepID=UPI001EC1FD68|nr:hypothetical protein [Mycobacterium sp.]MBW0019057.1 hypothetical protein [Mycobacterium sp.]
MSASFATSIKRFAASPAGLIVLGTLIRIPQLWHGLNEMHSFRQTQTAFVALEYARHGIDLMHTPLPVFGPHSDVPMDFPLVQAMAAVMIRLGAGAASAERAIGLLGFQVTAILLAVLVSRWHGRCAMLVVLALFEFSPFALAWGASALIEFPALALTLGMVVGLDSWFRNGSLLGLLCGLPAGWLAFLVKATTPPAWCVLVVISAATAFVTTRSWMRSVVGLLPAGIGGLAAAFGWARYGDAIKERNPLTVFLVSRYMNAWNFGTIKQRLDPLAYGNASARIAVEIAGPVGFGIVLAVCGIMLAPKGIERVRRAGWLVTAVVAPLIFFNLYYVHSYYLIAIFPALVAAVGLGIVAVAQRSRADTARRAVILTAIVAVGTAVPYNVLQWLVPPQPDAGGRRIQAATRPDDLIVVVGCDWNPLTLFDADRRGLMLTNYANVDVWTRENINDYHYIYSCDQNLKVTDYLPRDHTVKPTSEPGLWQIAPR